MHILYPQLSTGKETKRINQTCFSLTNRLYLSSGQHNSGCVRIDKLIVERSTFILNIYITGVCFN